MAEYTPADSAFFKDALRVMQVTDKDFDQLAELILQADFKSQAIGYTGLTKCAMSTGSGQRI
jgi:hypothetical protein